MRQAIAWVGVPTGELVFPREREFPAPGVTNYAVLETIAVPLHCLIEYPELADERKKLRCGLYFENAHVQVVIHAVFVIFPDILWSSVLIPATRNPEFFRFFPKEPIRERNISCNGARPEKLQDCSAIITLA